MHIAIFDQELLFEQSCEQFVEHCLAIAQDIAQAVTQMREVFFFSFFSIFNFFSRRKIKPSQNIILSSKTLFYGITLFKLA